MKLEKLAKGAVYATSALFTSTGAAALAKYLSSMKDRASYELEYFGSNGPIQVDSPYLDNDFIIPLAPIAAGISLGMIAYSHSREKKEV